MPTDNEVSACANGLILLPFYMKNLGHKTIQGHRRYIEKDNTMLSAYLDFLEKQSKSTWQGVVNVWGGDKTFLEMQRAILNNVKQANNL